MNGRKKLVILIYQFPAYQCILQLESKVRTSAAVCHVLFVVV